MTKMQKDIDQIKLIEQQIYQNLNIYYKDIDQIKLSVQIICKNTSMQN